ncbi:MAG: T9SS type A sorting domain-containing protein, partial [Tannerella sp.]|nr:T9SS type A sorting domain-containing protein [Tannerella sp.]
LYPNPATHDVYVRSDRPVSKVEIYSMSGACVWRTGDFTGKADVSGLESGVYAVRVYTSPAPQTKLLIVRK